jgi:predicted house-cleaning NTP pyrophosphatase (Maf/HAM1 superfamily)
MTLSIVPSNFLNSNHSSSASNIRTGFQLLQSKNSQQGEGRSLKVEFSTKFNTQLTSYLASGEVKSLLNGVKADPLVHDLNPGRALSLV